jgi:rhamnogalacturonyl hydrolase YesR
VDTVIAIAGRADGAKLMREVLSRAPARRSGLHSAIIHRLTRQPQSVAHVLAQRYPVEPGMNYIPALAWLNTVRLASIAHDDALREKVLRQIQPWLTGQKPLFGDRPQLNTIAGTMIFADLAKLPVPGREAAARLAASGVALAVAEKAPGVAQHGFGWSDDMFLGTVASARLGAPEALDAATRLLLESARQLQRPDGLFNHAANAPVAWGRGNGFAALGLTETLTALPPAHHARAAVLDIYRRHLAALKAQQAPDGMWRQIVDVAGSYREESVTALIVTSMARGVRLGWLDQSYRPVVLRGWRALLAHIVEDGTLVDVCTSTGAGPTRRYYLDRAAVNGSDDRGGAMALGAAIEVHELNGGS